MKKLIKPLLIVIGVALLLIIISSAFYYFKVQSEVKKMSSAETKQIDETVISVKDGFCNVYLIKDKDSDKYIAIDAGNNCDNISKELKKLNINPDKVATVLLTHTDGDHVAALPLFKNAKIFISTQEEDLINGKKSRFLFFGNKISSKEYTLINDRDSLNIGGVSVKGFLVPGHTPGSICYLINNKYLFTGDALSLKNGKVDIFNEFFNMDTETAVKSIDIITHLPKCEYILTAHHGYTSNYKDAIQYHLYTRNSYNNNRPLKLFVSGLLKNALRKI